MKKIILQKPLALQIAILYFLTTLASLPTIAQKNIPFSTDQLSISFAAQHQNAASFILTNKSKKNFPATGWKIYFNIKTMVKLQPENAGLSLQKMEGNLFQLAPTAAFKGIASGKNITTQITMEDPLINVNDQPEGFYVVWDSEPEKGYNIKNLTVSNVQLLPKNGQKISDFAATIYQRNAIINTEPISNLPAVFPTPLNYQQATGNFQLSGSTIITADPSFQKEAALLAGELQNILGQKPTVSTAATTTGIILKIKPGLNAEAYELTVTTAAVEIAATSSAGIFYGIQSFKTLLPVAAWSKKQQSLAVPAVTISDEPRFGYRGFMLDVARNFQTKTEVLRVLNLMALYKLNTFHFHLTEDEGWRLEIDGLPELTTLGANRGHSPDEKNNMPAAYGSGGDTGHLYGSGYYTKADFVDILQYAHERHISVITEIETPGHARAAIKAMDARYQKFMQQGNREEALKYLLRDTLDESVYSTPQWFHDDVINVALPSVYTFVEKVVTEVNKLYQQAGVPITTMHFGGDEVPAGAWEKSPACNQLIKTDPLLHNTNDLWYYYLGKVNNILKAKGITLSGWEEMGLRKTVTDGKNVMVPNPGFANNDMRLYVWNNTEGNEDLAYKLANSGYKIILTCVTNFYFDMIQYKTYDEPGYYWGSITDIAKAYEFIPFDYFKNVQQDHRGNPINRAAFQYKQRLSDYGKSNVLGLQAAVWSETIKGPQNLEYMLLPRLTALAERAWTKDPDWANAPDSSSMQAGYNKSWSSFVQLIGSRQLPLLDYYNGGYSYRIPPAGAIIKEAAVVANTQFPGLSIRYTSNGTAPTAGSPLYTGPITVKGIITLKVFNATGRSSYATVIENR